MNFSFIFKSLFISFFVFIIVFAIVFVSSQKNYVDNNNYGVRDTVKESINIAEYRKSGNIVFDEDALIKNTIKNYVANNNINVDEVTFEIALDEVNNIVTVKIYTEKELLNTNSEADYTFSYQVVERWKYAGF